MLQQELLCQFDNWEYQFYSYSHDPILLGSDPSLNPNPYLFMLVYTLTVYIRLILTILAKCIQNVIVLSSKKIKIGK